MKKYIVIIVFFCATTAQAQKVPAIDSINQMILLSDWGQQQIDANLHALPMLVFSKMELETVKKYKEDNVYNIVFSNGMSNVYVPSEGEQMLSYKGKYFYSLTRAAFVTKQKAVKAVKSPEAKERDQKLLVGGAALLGAVLGRVVANGGF